jgi:hypothetical protein
MRYPASEKLEIIRLVEESALPVQAVLSCALATSIVGAWPSVAHVSRLAEASHRLAAWRP